MLEAGAGVCGGRSGDVRMRSARLCSGGRERQFCIAVFEGAGDGVLAGACPAGGSGGQLGGTDRARGSADCWNSPTGSGYASESAPSGGCEEASGASGRAAPENRAAADVGSRGAGSRSSAESAYAGYADGRICRTFVFVFGLYLDWSHPAIRVAGRFGDVGGDDLHVQGTGAAGFQAIVSLVLDGACDAGWQPAAGC